MLVSKLTRGIIKDLYLKTHLYGIYLGPLSTRSTNKSDIYIFRPPPPSGIINGIMGTNGNLCIKIPKHEVQLLKHVTHKLGKFLVAAQ